MFKFINCLSVIVFSSSVIAANQNFNLAKKNLVKIYSNNAEQKEFYCGCDFIFENKKGLVDLSSCNYKIRKNMNRASRIEWEHVMPAENFGKHLDCWRSGGRKECKKDSNFNKIEGDLHNLQPAIGEVNGDRSNYDYMQRVNEPFLYGACKSTVSFKNKMFYPRDDIKGVIGRTYLYMNEKYKIRLSNQNKNLMNAWNNKFPPKEWECKRNNLIKKIQGNKNNFISEKCLNN